MRRRPLCRQHRICAPCQPRMVPSSGLLACFSTQSGVTPAMLLLFPNAVPSVEYEQCPQGWTWQGLPPPRKHVLPSCGHAASRWSTCSIEPARFGCTHLQVGYELNGKVASYRWQHWFVTRVVWSECKAGPGPSSSVPFISTCSHELPSCRTYSALRACVKDRVISDIGSPERLRGLAALQKQVRG